MSLTEAHAFAFSLATTLMVTIAVFRAGDGSFSVAPATEIDWDVEVVAEMDPYAP